jgi:hypothetical protein
VKAEVRCKRHQATLMRDLAAESSRAPLVLNLIANDAGSEGSGLELCKLELPPCSRSPPLLHATSFDFSFQHSPTMVPPAIGPTHPPPHDWRASTGTARAGPVPHHALLVRFLLSRFRAGSDGTQRTKPDSQGWAYVPPRTARVQRARRARHRARTVCSRRRRASSLARPCQRALPHSIRVCDVEP